MSPQVSIYVTDDIAAARDRERPHIAFYIGGMGVFIISTFTVSVLALKQIVSGTPTRHVSVTERRSS